MPSGHVALVGGAAFTDGCSFDRGLLDASDAEEVLVVPTGAAYEHPGRLVDQAVSWFEGLGAKARGLDILGRPDALDPDKVAEVRAARFLYLVGGSPMHLRQVLKDSPAWQALVDAWHDGATVAGDYGGAQVLCDPMVDPRGGAFTLGLGLIENVAVIPRHDHWSEDAAHRTRKLSPAHLVIVGIDERTALIRDPAGSWRAEGAGAVAVYEGGQPAGLDALPG
jgi:cyanophycinase